MFTNPAKATLNRPNISRKLHTNHGTNSWCKRKKSKATCKVVPSENVKQAKGKTSTPKKKGKKGKNESLAKIYKCPHCPNDPPYAGASGLWYHMKRHHGAVTRPYNSKKRREGRKNGKASQKTTKKKKKKKQPVVKKKKYVTKAAVSKFPTTLMTRTTLTMRRRMKTKRKSNKSTLVNWQVH